ncbi:MAG TPA: hypothetical protein VES20_03695 [Bryobacteraceae bacterium]|nr:hypothetical protein [Bryobacteraceae bacterium]
MRFSNYILPAERLAANIAGLLPDYVPGLSTGAAEMTDLRTCWTKTARKTMEALARSSGAEPVSDDVNPFSTERQLNMFWRRGNEPVLAASSGWGDRDQVDRSIQRLLMLKMPQKVVFYSCKQWQDQVLDQLNYALREYRHHIPGEQYIGLNVIGVERRVVATLAEVTAEGSAPIFRPMPDSPFVWSATAG